MKKLHEVVILFIEWDICAKITIMAENDSEAIKALEGFLLANRADVLEVMVIE